MTLHGQRVSYRTAGSGPPLLLLHGIANSSETWARVAPLLSERFTVIAPDLLGHGESATPRGDYSLGAHASGARDVATALGHERVTVVGHSLGGGIAMQFAYQFPERTERLVLVSSGGLGREVHLLLRAASLPGADYVLPALTSQRLVGLGRDLGGLLAARRAAAGRRHRRARARLRGARQRRLAPGVPAHPAGGRRARRPARQRQQTGSRSPPRSRRLIVWGEDDSIIPVAHGATAHEAMPGSRFVVFEGAGHLPQEAQPRRFAALLDRVLRRDRARAARRTTTGSRCCRTGHERRAPVGARRVVSRGREPDRADARRLGVLLRPAAGHAAPRLRRAVRPPRRAARDRAPLPAEARLGAARRA